MGELESIEKLVKKYKPRLEKIFGKEMGEVEVREESPSIYESLIRRYRKILAPMRIAIPVCLMDPKLFGLEKSILYVNLKDLKRVKQKFSPQEEDRSIVHELTHLLDCSNSLTSSIMSLGIRKFIGEGFAEYVALEFPEIYQDEEVSEYIRKKCEKKLESAERNQDKLIKKNNPMAPYQLGHKFFKKVADKVGRENVLKVFENLPQKMEEVLQPELYLQRIKGGSNGEAK